MKCAGGFITVLIASGSFAAADLPSPRTFVRYEPLMDRSPFAVSTAPAAPTSAADLYIASVSRMSDGAFVTLASRADKNFKKILWLAPKPGQAR